MTTATRKTGNLSQKDLIHQNEFLLELSDVTVEMLNHTDIDALFQRITERLLQLSGGCFTYIAIENDSGEYAEVKHLSSSGSLLGLNRVKRNEGIGGTAWAENRVIYTNNYCEFSNRIAGRNGVVQACAIPVVCEQGRNGVLTVLYDDPTIDVAAHIGLMQKFAQIVSAALDNARLHQKQAADLSMLEAMMKINQAIYQSTVYTDILESVCEMIIEGFNANRARVYRYKDGFFKGLAGRILAEDEALADTLPNQVILSESANLWTVENLEAAHIKTNTDDYRETPRVHAHRKKTGIGCSYIVPLIANDEAWGVLSVHKPIGQSDFNAEEKRLIDLMASQMSISINRQRLMQEIEHQANHDQLTGCVSRASFEKTLEQRVLEASGNNQTFSLLFVDLDGFKNINDTMGHDVGDRVLVHVSNQINKLLAKDMCVARLGGDEFAVLTPCGFTSEQASALGASIAGRLSAADTLSSAIDHVHASVGIARFPEHGLSAGDLLTCADIAMYHAKGSGSGQVRVYDAEFGANYTRRLTLKSKISSALANGEFELHYQPKVSTRDGTVSGAEALIRWNEPEFANVSPAEWIPLAEENGAIHKIGRWVTLEALRFLEELKKKNIDLKLSVNISATQFDAADFPGRFLSLLQESGAPGSSLEFEITETAVIKEIDVAVSKLQQIRAAGISIAIDDFGVEYSSLAYLGDLPLDVVKVDRVFVQQMENSAGRPMIEPILRLAQSLDLETVVEGVETEQQRATVSALGCDCIQGYFYSKPVPGAELPAVVEAINQAAKQYDWPDVA